MLYGKSPRLWVKVGDSAAIKVSTVDCINVNDYIRAVMSDLQLPNPPQDISIFLPGAEEPLKRSTTVIDLLNLEPVKRNGEDNPLLVALRTATSSLIY